jgi:hypothetical protein
MPRKYKRQDVKAIDKPATALVPRLAGQDPHAILLRYLSDESTSTIAADYGVTRQALGQFLLKHVEEDWKEAQVARAIARKEKAEDDIESATDALQLAKARELLKAAQWDLERTCKRIYGIDRDINFNLNIGDLGDRLRRAKDRERVIDVTPEQETA